MLTLETYRRYADTSSPQPFPWPPAPRTPFVLPPGDYNKNLPYTPPSQPDPRYVRGDAWGVTIPGLPFVPGGSSEHPERCLTGFYNRWDASWRTQIRKAHQDRGYTHVLLWLADAMVGPMPVTIGQYADLCAELRADGFQVCHWLGSKDWPQWIARDQNAAVWKSTLDPVFEALASVDGIQHAIIGGEFDLWNLGNPNDDTPFQIAEYVVQASPAAVYFHFSTHVTFWGDVPGSWRGQTIQTRFDWTRLMCDLGVRGIYYQGDSNWALNEYQGRICDTLGRVDARWDFVNCEVVASAEFSQDHPDEYDACIKGYGTQCALPATPTPMWGYFNGGYRPDGSGL